MARVNTQSALRRCMAAVLAVVLLSLGLPAHADQQRPTANTAGTKLTGERTFLWGALPSAPNSKVWTEVRLPSGDWSRSQFAQSNAKGFYTVQLTYGATTPGTTHWRIAVATPQGVVRSAATTLTRVAAPVAKGAPNKLVRQPTFTWGTFPGPAGTKVWTEVQLANGSWSRSQAATTRAGGGFTIPLTYGANSIGTYRWRVAGVFQGRVVRSQPFTLQRRDFNFSSCARAAHAERGLQTRAKRVLRAVCHEFPDITRYLGRGSRGNTTFHSTGRAIDVMVSGSRGWEVAHMMHRHADRLGVQEIIYERRIWTKQRSSEGWRLMRSRGSARADHYDHVHISIP